MLTIFTTAKPFRGHFHVIQRNALKSWTLLHPDVEIILFGEDEGAAEVCGEFGLRHEPDVKKTEFGSIRLDDMFAKAQAIARHSVLCYANCDIILLTDFCAALERVNDEEKPFLMPFLMIGRRWDIDITEPLAFDRPDWESQLRALALSTGKQRSADWIDYFAFSRGTYGEIPSFAVGRTCWDNWLVWNAVASGHPVVDASRAVVAVHQNHDYSHHPQGAAGVWRGEEMARNLALTGGLNHQYTIAHAPFRLTSSGIEPSRFHSVAKFWWTSRRNLIVATTHALIAWQNAVWHPVLNVTRPLRTALGLRKTPASNRKA